MKWILGAILAAVIAWYFANETLQYLGLAVAQSGEWKIIATGWHILGKMWPVWLILILGIGVVIALVLHFFSSAEEKMQDEFEKRLIETKSNDMKLLNKLHRDMAIEKQALERMKAENEKLVRKINHQHSTIQRLYKKIDTLKSSF